jgi:hypothetical protein
MPIATGGGLHYLESLTRYEDYQMVWYPERWGHIGKYHQAIGDLNIGEKEILVPTIEAAGRAAFHTGQATDVPLMKLGASGDRYGSKIIVIRWELDELSDIAPANYAAQNGRGLRENLMVLGERHAYNKISERENEFVIFGDPASNMAGLLSGDRQGVHVEQVAAGTNIHTLTPEAQYDLLRGWGKTFYKRTKLIAQGNLLLVTVDLYDSLCRKFTDGDGSPLERLTDQEQGGYFRAIEPINEASSELLEEFSVHAPGTNRDRAAIVDARYMMESPDGMRTESPIVRNFYTFDRTPIRQATDTTYSFTAFCATTEMQFRQPVFAMYVDYDKWEAV